MRVEFETTERFEKLVKKCGSRKDMINSALTLLSWVNEMENQGCNVCSIDKVSKEIKILRLN